MKNPKTAVIVVSKFNLDLAVLVLKKIENCQIHGLNIIDAKVDISFKNLANEELKAAVRMGIIEPVPAGETSDWCAPMMTVGKKAGGV